MYSTQLLARFVMSASMFGVVSAHAGFVVSGAAVQIAAPASVVPNLGIENNTQVAVFAERQGFTLAQNVQVDATSTGLFDALSDLTPGAILAGTRVSSYYLEADPVGASGVVYTYIGSVSFDSDILGVAALNAQLLSTNILGAAGTVYPGAATVNGLDYADGTDWFAVSADRRTLNFRFAAWGGADALRVVTQANDVPEPATLALASAALGALVLVRRRRTVQG